MRKTLPHSLALLLTLTTPTLAQTFIVDQQNGPGANFTSIAAAVAAVPDGALIRIRAGFYIENFAIVAKGLTIVGETGAVVSAPMSSGNALRIDRIGPSQSVCIRNLAIAQNNHSPVNFRIACSNSPGLILIDGTPAMAPCHLNLEARSCDRVAVRDCNFTNPIAYENVHAENSNCVFENCQLGAGYGSGIVQVGGSVQLVDTSVSGGLRFVGAAPAGIVSNGGDLRILGASSVTGGFTATNGNGYAIAGTSQVRLEPGVALQGSTPPLQPTLVVTTMDMPRLRTAVLATGTQIRAELFVPNGHLGILAVAFPGPVLTLPGFADLLWLDAGSLLLLGVGAPGPAALSHTWNLSGALSSVGLRLAWQGLTHDPVGGFQLSNPSLQLIR